MPAAIHPALSGKNRWRIIGGALGFWLIIGLMIYGTELIAHYFFPAHILDQVEQQQYLLRWLLWLLLTPAIIYMGARINTGNHSLTGFVLLHLLLGTGILLLEFLIEASVIRPLAEQVYKRHVILGELILPFLFKYFAYIVIYFLMVGIVSLYLYMFRLQQSQRDLMQAELYNKELQYQVTLSRLETLKMQIHPHFLFNTHHSVISLISKGEPAKAARMLQQLSDLLRLTLKQQDSAFVALDEELQLMELYLQIQQIRFSGRLTYTRNVSSAAAQFPIPFFILQPLIENAVIHGAEQQDEPVCLHIEAWVKDHQLSVQVINSNKGGAPLPEVIRPGIGITNVRERLQQYYGTAASFSLHADEQDNTIATINLPRYEA